MRKAMAILSMIFAVVLLVLSLVTFADKSPSGYDIYVVDKQYGGDAYTGIQNAAADTARAAAATAERVGGLNNTLANIGGGVLLAASFAFFLVSLNFFRPETSPVDAEKDESPIDLPVNQSNDTVQAPVVQKVIPDSAEERIVASGVCPDCNGTLEKSEIFGTMICSKCGRMFE